MAGSPRVQLSLKGRLLSEVAFAGPQLRIGRMRENDVVVNNVAVSRFHAVLRREGDGFVLEDLGGENGTLLNGGRVQGSAPITASDVVQLGKYELRIVMQDGPQNGPAPTPRRSDAWDASQTFLALDPPLNAARHAASQAPTLEAPAATPTAQAMAFELSSQLPAATETPDPDGVFAFGDEDLVADQPLVAEAAEFGTDPLLPNPEHTSLFDFGSPADADAGEAAPDAFASEEPSGAPDADAPPSKLYAGLIVQRDGKLHLLRPWEGGDLCAGRAPECDIVLADAGVSRRHVLFSRTPEGHAVSDLESVNGIYVNGQRTKLHRLEVGDVVRVESFEMTFVLDHQPIGSEVNGPKAITPKLHDSARTTQFSLEAPAFESNEAFELAPLAGDPSAAPGELGDARTPESSDGFEILPPADDPFDAEAETAEPVLELNLPESDLVSAEGFDDDDEKQATVQGMQGVQGSQALGAAVALSPGNSLQLRLRVDTSQLSPRAREAIAVLVDEGVVVSGGLAHEDGRER